MLLLAAASLTPAYGEATFPDLNYVSRVPGECVAQFGGGSIEIRQAFNEKAGTMINVAVIKGKLSRALREGMPL